MPTASQILENCRWVKNHSGYEAGRASGSHQSTSTVDAPAVNALTAENLELNALILLAKIRSPYSLVSVDCGGFRC